MSDCPHDLADRETACADGLCPLCLQTAIEARDRTIAELRRDLASTSANRNEADRCRKLAEAEIRALRNAAVDMQEQVERKEKALAELVACKDAHAPHIADNRPGYRWHDAWAAARAALGTP